MLVRSQNHVLTEGGDALTFDTSLEYFCNQGRGMEVVPVVDPAYWLMQKILQPSKRIILCRIDPCTGRVLRTEEKTVADTMTLEDAAPHESGMSSLFNFDRSEESSVENVIGSMFDILCATRKLERGVKSRSVMCYPGFHSINTSSLPSSHQVLAATKTMTRSCSIASIHKEFIESPTPDGSGSTVNIDVEKQLEDAHQVTLNPELRMWSWNQDCLAYSFPCNDR
jgi:hypothetical protein